VHGGRRKTHHWGNLCFEYKQWCELNGHKPKSSTSVSEDWQRLGFERGGVRA
jgi:hypothetical protein